MAAIHPHVCEERPQVAPGLAPVAEEKKAVQGVQGSAVAGFGVQFDSDALFRSKSRSQIIQNLDHHPARSDSDTVVAQGNIVLSQPPEILCWLALFGTNRPASPV